ncbi:hypothetical protein [Aliidiomarina celeris]|uniref:hypothetical protein n=1 Tax=Aliidiomarina celeris TaxID=2249428 RepID=UPI000DE8E612|nr:hypothetical protein [Aliidiomarina celeris]
MEFLSSFIGRSNQALNEERMRRILIATEMLNRFAPAWQNLYENTHISMPENALVQYSRYQPWGRQADAELDMTKYSVVRSTLQAFNLNREGRWSGLYYDLSSKQWVVTYQLPVDYQGRHLGTPSHDIQLEDIFARLIEIFNISSTTLVPVRRLRTCYFWLMSTFSNPTTTLTAT